jgi:O-antigen/teichoic acid export membrane protein
MKNTYYILLISILPLMIFIYYHGYFFSIVFSEQWTVAGSYAVWMTIQGLFLLLSRPAISAIPVLGLNRFFLNFEIGITVLKIIILYLGVKLLDESIDIIKVYSFATGIFYLLLTLFIFYISKKKIKNETK